MSHMPSQLTNTPNKLYFYCGITDVVDGRKLQAYRPDESGYFCGYPLSVFGEQSLNTCYYDTNSYYNAITNPKSSFNLKLTSGNLYGEWGHPPDDSTLSRMGSISRSKQSHHFRNIFIDQNDNSPNAIIRGDVKPCGPYGKFVEESMLNPFENTAFSLRCLMTEKFDRSLKANVRTIVDLITFDCVDMPGYLKASKRYVNHRPATERMIPITIDMLYDEDGKRVGLESFNDKQVLDLFGVTNFNLHGQSLGSYIQGTGTYIDHTGNRKSVLHSFLTNI